jgi:hypothetical protein
MTGSQSHRTESQDAVSTKKVNEAEIIVEFKDTTGFERLKPDSKRFKSISVNYCIIWSLLNMIQGYFVFIMQTTEEWSG